MDAVRMGIVFLLCCTTIVLMEKRGIPDVPDESIEKVNPILFCTGRTFNILSVVIIITLVVFYWLWW